MKKEDLIKDADEIKELLIPRECTNPERLQFLHDKWKNCPAIKDLFSKDYDRKVMHPGFGSEGCYCHIMPPCENCVAMTEEEYEARNK